MTKATKLHSLPTLDELAADPCRAEELSSQEAGQFLSQLAGVQTTLMGRIVSGNGTTNGVHQDDGDTLLTVKEAADKLSTTEDWLYHNSNNLPFTVKLSDRQLRFSSKGIEKYLKNRLKGGA